MAYADYEFYTKSFFGNAIAEADFPRLSSRASDFIDYYTRGKSTRNTSKEVDLLLAKCCCALAEQMQTDEQNAALAAKAREAALASGTGEVKSESVGSWSVSYATAGDYMSNDARKAQETARIIYSSIAAQYLANTGLLYRGGPSCTCPTP